MVKQLFISKLALLACCFTLVVIALGAYTRLIDAGLGCPDWPGCYGHITVPDPNAIVSTIKAQYPTTPLVTHKAWAEMIHRYFAGALGLLMLLITYFGIGHAYKTAQYKRILFFIGVSLLLGLQITLGMLTVTWQLLPLIVCGHLLGGMLILCSMWSLYLAYNGNSYRRCQHPQISKWRGLAMFGLLLLFGQLFLGAWTSTNYASLSCTSFPGCSSQFFLPIGEFVKAFNIVHPVGVNYEGGVLSTSLRQIIQMTHRFGALIIGFYFLGYVMLGQFSHYITVAQKRAMLIVMGIIIWQIMLGIANVLYQLPITTAILHTISAGLLAMSILYLIFELYRPSEFATSCAI